MRIAVLGSGTTSRDLPAHLAALSDATTQVAIVNPRLAVFPATAYERLIVDLGYVDAAEEAHRGGFDAVAINSFADYGIGAIRAAGITAFGSGEAALRAAAKVGPRFSIVTIWPASMAYLYDERLRALDLGTRCARVRHVGVESDLATLGTHDNVMAQLHRGDVAMLQRVLGECRAAIAQDGIQSIVLGCTCMAPIATAVGTALDFPVMEGSALAVRAAKASGTRAIGRRTSATIIGALVDAWLHRSARTGDGTGDGDGDGDASSLVPEHLHANLPSAGSCDVCVP